MQGQDSDTQLLDGGDSEPKRLRFRQLLDRPNVEVTAQKKTLQQARLARQSTGKEGIPGRKPKRKTKAKATQHSLKIDDPQETNSDVDLLASCTDGPEQLQSPNQSESLHKPLNQIPISQISASKKQPLETQQEHSVGDSWAREHSSDHFRCIDTSRSDAPPNDSSILRREGTTREDDHSSITLEDFSDGIEVTGERLISDQPPVSSTAASAIPKMRQQRRSKVVSVVSNELGRPPKSVPGQSLSPSEQLLFNESSSRLGQRKGSQKSTSRFPNEIQFNPNGEAIPFVRPAFPKLIRDRSPILGLSNQIALRVCFRIGEALNAASWALRNNFDLTVELYARVTTSEREAFKQNFSFADLFTDKPPYLRGVWSMWKGVALWDEDALRLLSKPSEGNMCRVMGKLSRESGNDWEMSILSVWAVGWEDVEAAKASVCP